MLARGGESALHRAGLNTPLSYGSSIAGIFVDDAARDLIHGSDHAPVAVILLWLLSRGLCRLRPLNAEGAQAQRRKDRLFARLSRLCGPAPLR
jgi:hypothetical protein